MIKSCCLLLCLLSPSLTACNEDPSSVQRIGFAFQVAGADRDASSPLKVTTPLGWTVEIDAAEISVAAAYFRDAKSATGTADEQGRVTAQVLGPFTVDALDPQLMAAEGGSAVTERALDAELWLTEAETGPIADLLGPDAALAHVAGVAVRDASSIPFDGAFSWPLESNQDSYESYLNRQIRRISADFVPRSGGRLTLRVDPSHWLDAVSFDTLAPSDGTRTFTSQSELTELRNGLAAVSGYAFSWTDRP
jgi:hypothetical protein